MTCASSTAWTAVAREYQRHIVPDFRPAVAALCRFAQINPGDRVLDVACGPGTASFAALEAGAATVIGVDQATGMIAVARELAAGRKELSFLEGDALRLPMENARFDVVLSSFGVIFVPTPAAALAEMARVLRRRGRIGLLAWQRVGDVARYYECVDRYIPRDTSYDPFAWGVPAQVADRLDPWFTDVRTQTLAVGFEAPSAAEAWRRLRTSTARISAAYGELSDASRSSLDAELESFFSGLVGPDGRVHWSREALLIGAARRDIP